MEAEKLIWQMAPRLAELPDEMPVARIVVFNENGIGGQALEYKRVEGGWEHSRIIPAPEIVEMKANLKPDAQIRNEELKRLMNRAFALFRYVQKEPEQVRTLFEEVWGRQLGAHLHDKLHYHFEDRVDDWWCSIDQNKRETILNSPRFDILY